MNPLFAVVAVWLAEAVVKTIGTAAVNQQLSDAGLTKNGMDKASFQRWLLTDFVATFREIFRKVIQEEDLRRLTGRIKGIQDNLVEFNAAPTMRLGTLGQVDIELDTMMGELETLECQSLPAYTIAAGDHVCLLQERFRWFKDPSEKNAIASAIERHVNVINNFINQWRDAINSEGSMIVTTLVEDPGGDDRPKSYEMVFAEYRGETSFWRGGYSDPIFIFDNNDNLISSAPDPRETEKTEEAKKWAGGWLGARREKRLKEANQGVLHPAGNMIDSFHDLLKRLPTLAPADVGPSNS